MISANETQKRTMIISIIHTGKAEITVHCIMGGPQQHTAYSSITKGITQGIQASPDYEHY